MAERKKLISIFFADMKYFCQLNRKTPTTLHIQRVATHLIWKHCWMTIGKRHWRLLIRPIAKTDTTETKSTEINYPNSR